MIWISLGIFMEQPSAHLPLWYRMVHPFLILPTFHCGQDQLILHAILASVSEAIVPLVSSSTFSKDALARLSRLYAKRSTTHIIHLKDKLTTITRGSLSVTEFLVSINPIGDELTLLGAPSSDADLLVYATRGLGVAHKELVTYVRTRDSVLPFEDYYLNPFHAYDEGNLSWLAAAEAEPATMSQVRRTIPYASSLDEANQIVRGNWLNAIESHHKQHSGGLIVNKILDIGCSVGVSTSYLADKYPTAEVTGLDLSPYFLAVAQFKEKNRNLKRKTIKWIHGNGESTGLPSKSFDIVSAAFLFHECPERAIRSIMKEAFRLLRPGGTFELTDSSPKSKILQELSPVLFTLAKSTEPFSDEYYLTNIDEVAAEAGFVNVQTVLTDPRNRTVTATVPY